MTITTEQIKSLTTEEKIELIGILWDDLTTKPSNPDIPPEHQEILKKRLNKINEGEVKFRPWNQVRSKYLQ